MVKEMQQRNVQLTDTGFELTKGYEIILRQAAQ